MNKLFRALAQVESNHFGGLKPGTILYGSPRSEEPGNIYKCLS